MDFNKGLMITNFNDLEKENNYLFEIRTPYELINNELNEIYTYTSINNYLLEYTFINSKYTLHLFLSNLEEKDGIFNIDYIINNNHPKFCSNLHCNIFKMQTSEYVLK